MRGIVTKASDDSTFVVGDHISFEEDGTILCTEAGGWIEAENVAEATKGMEWKHDEEWIIKERQQLLRRLDKINTIVDA
jgi:hypothetical protein